MFKGKNSMRKSLQKQRHSRSGTSESTSASTPPTDSEGTLSAREGASSPSAAAQLFNALRLRTPGKGRIRSPTVGSAKPVVSVTDSSPLSVDCQCGAAAGSSTDESTGDTLKAPHSDPLCQIHGNIAHHRSNSASPKTFAAMRGNSLISPLRDGLYPRPGFRYSPSLYLPNMNDHPTSNGAFDVESVDSNDSETSSVGLELRPIFSDDVLRRSSLIEESQDAVYSLFMKAHKCYDVVPTSSKVVVFDTDLTVNKAFYALVYNGVRAATLWDNKEENFVGMLTITDFIQILTKYYKKKTATGEVPADVAVIEGTKELDKQKISAWRDVFKADGHVKPFVYIDELESLYRAVEILCENKIHRLPVVEHGVPDILYILTHKRIIKFLYLYMADLPRPTFMDKTPKELGIGSWTDICTISKDTPLIEALKMFLEKRVSAVPLVDADGRVVDIYAKFDVINLAADNSYTDLDVTVHEALKHRKDWFEGVRTCSESDTLSTVIDNIVHAEVHRLIVTDDEQRVVGIISLSDILKHLILDPPAVDLPAAIAAATIPDTGSFYSSSSFSSQTPPATIHEDTPTAEAAAHEQTPTGSQQQ